MDSYRTLEEWGPGSFGDFCLVEDLKENTKYVIKKVECMDEREANLAAKEAAALLRLQHPNICAYKEFFITWDNKISSLFFCLVTDFYPYGDVAALVSRNRQRVQNTEEKLIQILLGQTIDALVYIHKHNLTHRNLKSSNIFLKDETSFLIGDLLLETLAADEMRMKKRLDDGWWLWTAPEALRLTYSEKSDVWSLGCILLELMTCSVYTGEMVVSILNEIRVNPRCLEKVVPALQSMADYSSDLCQLLPLMLQMEPEKRCTVNELVEVACVKQCLALAASPLSALKHPLLPGTIHQLAEAPIDQILEFMQRHSDSEDAQIAAIRQLSAYARHPDGWQHIEEILPLVLQAMQLHCSSSDVLLDGCKFLQDLVTNALEHGSDSESFTSRDLVLTLVAAARSFADNRSLLPLICQVLILLSTNEAATEILGQTGFLEDVVKVMGGSLQSREMCVCCCRLLWSIGAAGGSSQSVWLELAVPRMVTLLSGYMEDAAVVEVALGALWITCLKGCVAEKETERVSQVLLETLQTHPTRPALVKNGLLALASIIRTSELALYRILLPGTGKSVISLVKEIYQLHSDDPEIVENICLLFYDMAQYGDIRAELLSQHVESLLREINVKYESTEEIVSLAQSTLSSLEI
ncbi:serine/threonine kinase-like domain containing 1 L homeolog [Xenopus laevis]|uniref:Serine/threonine kinase-like domain-containing protein STKLD1 n=1 Tax=Xenopus laevis TaxID=8355 RepID=Q5PQ95_XENLA|nr:serine/threonine kinase-like domain containing 1 L homeolog [Xenopus laevis]AAH87305.1 LOC495941 protein [Xenopus laevis]